MGTGSETMPQRSASQRDGRILAVEESDAGTLIEISTSHGSAVRRLRTRSHPDRGGARRILGSTRRADWVLLDLGNEGCATLGVPGHRVPQRLRISLATALGLAEAGVPAFVAGGVA